MNESNAGKPLQTSNDPAEHAPGSRSRDAAARPIYFAIGLLFTGLGIVGALLPLMPTTCFLLVATWAFAKSSPRFHDWLLEHRHFGPALRQWQRDRSIPRRAKQLALASMAASLILIGATAGLEGWLFPISSAFLLLSAIIVARLPTNEPRARHRRPSLPLKASSSL